MRRYFADSFYFLALLNEDDHYHERVLRFLADLDAPIVTTDWILTEVGDALAGARDRRGFMRLTQHLRRDPEVFIVPARRKHFDEAFGIYAKRMDKDWSLTDCVSFNVMMHLRLTGALTADRHFEQAGFTILLNSPG